MAKLARYKGRYIDQFPNIVEKLRPQMEFFIREAIIDDIQLIFKDAIGQISEHWKGGDRPLESISSVRKDYEPPRYNPKPSDFTIKFKSFTQTGVIISIEGSFEVVGDDGGLHDLFIWLNFGTQTITWTGEPSASFPYRAVNRTQPGTLKVGNDVIYSDYDPISDDIPNEGVDKTKIVFEGSSGEARTVLYPGATRKGIEARLWTEVIEDNIRNAVSSKYPEWNVVHVPTKFE